MPMSETIDVAQNLGEHEETVSGETDVITAATTEKDNSEETAPEQPTLEPERPQTFEEIVAEVEAYFGGRVFTFKSYSGTAAEIAALCPMAKMAFMRGAEFAISFLEKFDGTPEPKKEEEPAEEPAEAEEEAALQQPIDTKQKPDARYAVQEKETEIALAKTNVAQVAISMVMREAKTPEPLSVQADVTERAPLPQPVVFVEQKPVKRAKAEAKTLKTHERQPVVEIPEPVATVTEPVKAKGPVGKEVVEQSRTDAAPVRESIVATVDDELVGEIIPVLEMEETIMELDAELSDDKEAIGEEDAVTPEQSLTEFLEFAKDEPEESDDMTEDVIGESSLFESAESESVQEEAIMEEASTESQEATATDIYEMIAEQLGIEHTEPSATEAPDEQFERSAEVVPVAPLLTIVEEIIDVSEEAQPEMKQYLVEVVRSIEVLKWSRTAEECQEAVSGLKANLTRLFEALGYDDPELTAMALLEQYDIESIDKVMAVALKIARSKRTAHMPRLASLRRLLIGRHVVRLLFGAVPSGGLLSRPAA